MDIRKILIICLIVIPLFMLFLYRDMQHQQRYLRHQREISVLLDRDHNRFLAAIEKDPTVRQEYISRAEKADKALKEVKL